MDSPLAIREFKIEEYFCKQMAKHFPGCEIRKFEKKMHDPDRIVFLPNGVAILVELKRPGKEPRDGQHRAIQRFLDLGFFCSWASTKEGVDRMIELIHLECE